jgi:hypothetical protein
MGGPSSVTSVTGRYTPRSLRWKTVSDLSREQIEDDLLTQGIDETETEDVLRSTRLYERADPNWTYNPDPDEDVYAPTASEMFPFMVPPEGWPPSEEEEEPPTTQ